MSLDVSYESGGYHVSVAPPHSGEPWRSSRPLTATEVLEVLAAKGCHSTDITDALFAANPNWVKAHDSEVRRRREEQLQARQEGVVEDGSAQRGDE